MDASATSYANLPEATQRWLIDVHARARDLFAEVLARHGGTPGLGSAVARARIGFLDRELKQVAEAVAKAGTPVACRGGCASCCTLKVEATPDEIFAVAAALEAALDPESLAALRAQAAEIDRRGRDLAPAARYLLHLFCPVMEPDSRLCRAHTVRPAACQGYLSLDRRRCDASAQGENAEIPSPVASGLIRDAVMSAQIIVLREAGYDQTRIELSAGLTAAWADPDAERRWLAGGPAFVSGTFPAA